MTSRSNGRPHRWSMRLANLWRDRFGLRNPLPLQVSATYTCRDVSSRRGFTYDVMLELAEVLELFELTYVCGCTGRAGDARCRLRG